MLKRILVALGGVFMIVASIAMIPHCDGDGTYLCMTIPFGLVMIFGQKYLDLD